ncbi:MAG TPA: hypothetical protein VEW26_05870 [Allosphingosinicella sp.]|nr:hypothetical protein [Allosphingosinicella sp.]
MILDRIDLYLRASKTAPSRLGRDAVGDPNFVMNLRDGRRPRQATVDRVIEFIDRQEQALRRARHPAAQARPVPSRRSLPPATIIRT